MVYTEIKERNGKKYFYRVKTVRKGEKFKKHRVYLGVNLKKEGLLLKEKEADKKLNSTKLKEIEKLKSKIIEVLKRNNVKKAGIFGSYARGRQKKGSDIDIIIEPPKGIGFGFVGIEMALEKALGKKIDLITYKYISPYLKDRILAEEIKIL